MDKRSNTDQLLSKVNTIDQGTPEQKNMKKRVASHVQFKRHQLSMGQERSLLIPSTNDTLSQPKSLVKQQATLFDLSRFNKSKFMSLLSKDRTMSSFSQLPSIYTAGQGSIEGETSLAKPRLVYNNQHQFYEQDQTIEETEVTVPEVPDNQSNRQLIHIE